MNERRSGLALALMYGLATLLAPGLHDHARHASEPAAVGMAGCDDPRPHYAGHSAPELGGRHLDCVACQLRAEASSNAPRLVMDSAPPRLHVSPTFVPHARRVATSRPSPRAPPLA